MVWYRTPKQDAHRRLLTNIEYKKQKQQYNNARLQEVRMYRENYETYKKIAEECIPTMFFNININDVSKETTLIKTKMENIKSKEKKLLEEITNLKTQIKEKEKEIQKKLDIFMLMIKVEGIENVRMYNGCKDEYMWLIEQKREEFNKEEEKIKAQIGGIYEEIYGIEDELEELKEEMKKLIEDEKMYDEINALRINVNSANYYLKDLFKNTTTNTKELLNKYHNLCNQLDTTQLYSDKEIKKIRGRYIKYFQLADRYLALMNGSKSRML